MLVIDIKKRKEFLREIKKTKIVVIGDSMLDIFSYGKTERLSPEAPVPVIDIFSKEFTLGGAANVARNIRSLGGEVSLFSVVGNDEHGSSISRMLKKEKINSFLVESETRQTTVKERILEGNKHFVRIDIELKNPIVKKIETKLIKNFQKEANSADVLIFSDYAKGVITERIVSEFCKIAHTKKIPIIVDTKPKNASLFRGKKITLFTPNLKEAHDISGKKNMKEVSKYLQHFFGAPILITEGEKGMTLYENNKSFHVDAQSSTIVDVSGCGDTVISTLALAIATKKSMHEAVSLANFVAGIVVQKKGTAVVTAKELLQY